MGLTATATTHHGSRNLDAVNPNFEERECVCVPYGSLSMDTETINCLKLVKQSILVKVG